MSKHTPEPWAVDAGYIVGLEDPKNAVTIAVFADGATPSKDDGHLIETGPKMLKALKLASDAIASMDDRALCIAEDYINAAIAEATKG